MKTQGEWSEAATRQARQDRQHHQEPRGRWGTDAPSEPPEDTSPPDPLISDLGSPEQWEHIPVVLSHVVCGHLLRWPWETHTVSGAGFVFGLPVVKSLPF